MIEIGRHTELEILRETSVGLYLGDGEEDILLPNKYVPKDFLIGESIKVFVYLDHEERKVAVTLTPKINLHEFALLKVADVTAIGAFMDWGMEKHLLVPFKEQLHKMEVGQSYVVYMDIDKQSNRLYASSKIDKHLRALQSNLKEGEEVEALLYHRSDLGFSAVVNNKYPGLVFRNEVFKTLNYGDTVKAFVKKVRPDNKLDLSLQPLGFKKSNDSHTEIIFRYLQKNNGFLPLNDKSSPEEIYAKLGMSKKAFKKSVGSLYKRKKVRIADDGIYFVSGDGDSK